MPDLSQLPAPGALPSPDGASGAPSGPSGLPAGFGLLGRRRAKKDDDK